MVVWWKEDLFAVVAFGALTRVSGEVRFGVGA